MRVLTVLYIGLSVIFACTASRSKIPFRYILEEEHHAVAGRVIYDAHRGARVKAIPEKSQSESEHGTEEEAHFLRLVKRLANPRKPLKTTVRFDISGMTRMPEPSRLTARNVRPSESTSSITQHTGSPSNLIHTIHRRSFATSNHVTNENWSTSRESITSNEHMTNNHAEDEPLFEEEEDVRFNEDLIYNVIETDRFYIDDENYIVVANSSGFEELDNVEFYVYLSTPDGEVVSNPLAFIVYIDKPEEKSIEYPPVPAIFAGVLVLIIVFLALFIPFVTRAKRRYKQGKPIFKMGSHPSMADLEREAVLNRVETREPNWYGNNTMFNYEEEVQKERSEFTRGIKNLSKKNTEPPTLQLHKKIHKASSSSSSSEATGSTQDDTKYESQRL